MRHHEFIVVAGRLALLGAAMLMFKVATAHTIVPRSQVEPPAFFRLMLGEYEVTVLWDGTATRQFDRIMSKPAVIRDVYERNHETLPAAMSINTFLINTRSQLVLIDSGGGSLVGDHAGRLLANLRASGYQPEQIDAVLLTHMHPDHVGGLLDSGRRTFPNALIYVDRRDADYWLGTSTVETTPALQAMRQQAHASMGPYEAAGMLRPFDGVTTLFPGIRALPAPGHTVGHTAYMVESKGDQLLLWGDIIHSAATQFLDPLITIQFDTNPQSAIESRLRLLADAAKQGYLVGSAHITFPGLGHVSSDGQAYGWAQLPYTAP